MNANIVRRAGEIITYYKSKYNEGALWQVAIALAEMEERYTVDMKLKKSKGILNE